MMASCTVSTVFVIAVDTLLRKKAWRYFFQRRKGLATGHPREASGAVGEGVL